MKMATRKAASSRKRQTARASDPEPDVTPEEEPTTTPEPELTPEPEPEPEPAPAKARGKAKPEGYIANTSASIENPKTGEAITITNGATRLRAGHWAVKQVPSFFEPIETHYDYEPEER
jgi:hypothetical protein